MSEVVWYVLVATVSLAAGGIFGTLRGWKAGRGYERMLRAVEVIKSEQDARAAAETDARVWRVKTTHKPFGAVLVHAQVVSPPDAASYARFAELVAVAEDSDDAHSRAVLLAFKSKGTTVVTSAAGRHPHGRHFHAREVKES